MPALAQTDRNTYGGSNAVVGSIVFAPAVPVRANALMERGVMVAPTAVNRKGAGSSPANDTRIVH